MSIINQNICTYIVRIASYIYFAYKYIVLWKNIIHFSILFIDLMAYLAIYEFGS